MKKLTFLSILILLSFTLFSPKALGCFLEVTVNDENLTIEFTSSTSKHWIEVSDDPSFSNIIDDQFCMNCSTVIFNTINFPFPNQDKTYYVRARQIATGVCASESLTPTPDLLPPRLITNASFEARWNSVPGINSYQLQASESSAFSSLAYNSNVTGTSKQVTGLDDNTTYYWRVKCTGASPSTFADSYHEVTTYFNPLAYSLAQIGATATTITFDLSPFTWYYHFFLRLLDDGTLIDEAVVYVDQDHQDYTFEDLDECTAYTLEVIQWFDYPPTQETYPSSISITTEGSSCRIGDFSENLTTGNNPDTQESKGGLTIYPNPTHNFINIQFDDKNADYGNFRYMLLDQSGRIIEEQFLNKSCLLDIQKLRPGIYFLKLKADGFNDLRKIIKQ